MGEGGPPKSPENVVPLRIDEGQTKRKWSTPLPKHGGEISLPRKRACISGIRTTRVFGLGPAGPGPRPSTHAGLKTPAWKTPNPTQRPKSPERPPRLRLREGQSAKQEGMGDLFMPLRGVVIKNTSVKLPGCLLRVVRVVMGPAHVLAHACSHVTQRLTSWDGQKTPVATFQAIVEGRAMKTRGPP